MKFWQVGIIILAVLFVFVPALGTYFSQDDWVFLSHTYKQPFIKIFDHHSETFYRPVGQQLFFWIGSRLFGLNAGGFHLLAILVHLINIILLWKLFRYFPAEQGPAPRDKILIDTKLFLLLFYAVNPAHFVALNWLTQTDIEIAVGFGLVSIYLLRPGLASQGQAFLLQICGFALYLFGVLSHEVVVFLPVVWWLWFRQKRAAIVGLAAGLALISAKFLANPFSSNADYTVSTNILGIISTLKWYGLRALFVPEGIRNLPVWLAVASLVPAVFLILTFRQRLIKAFGIYLLGILPVLGFGSHLLAAYSIFGIALMAIELGKSTVVSRMTMVLGSAILLLATTGFIYFSYPSHWSTTRGIISQRLSEEYLGSGSGNRLGILEQANNFKENPEIYFSSMIGGQYNVLNRGVSKGVFDLLFHRGNDLTTQFLPDALFFKNSFLAGKFPGWNPWIMAGMPYFLDPQNFLWYPPNYLLLLVPLEIGFFILLIGHLVFAGLFVRKVSDTLQSNRLIGWLGAAMFVFSPKLIGHIEEGNWSLVIAACWLPFLYWALKNKRFNWTAISLAAIIINNLNIGYYSILFVILFLLFQKRTGLAPARPGLQMLKILITTVILTIPRWLPLAFFGNQTVRANLQEAPLPFWSWMKIIKSLFFPLAGSHPVLQNEEILYVGIIPVILTVAYLLRGLGMLGKFGKLGEEKRFWIIWLGFVSLITINLKTPFFYLIRLLPGFSLLRITTRPWIFVSLALAIFVPRIINRLFKCSKLLAVAMTTVILLEFAYFDYGIFARRQVAKDPVPSRFYEAMAKSSVLSRVYCTTGCLDRLTAQNMGIALLGGNNPIQLKEFVHYLQKAGGYDETGYFPILPPYTVFNRQPQPDAGLLAQTATKFVISPYELKDDKLKLIDQEQDYRLYQNTVDSVEYKDHYFSFRSADRQPGMKN